MTSETLEQRQKQFLFEKMKWEWVESEGPTKQQRIVEKQLELRKDELKLGKLEEQSCSLPVEWNWGERKSYCLLLDMEAVGDRLKEGSGAGCSRFLDTVPPRKKAMLKAGARTRSLTFIPYWFSVGFAEP